MGSTTSSTQSLFCEEYTDSSFPEGFGIGIVTGLLLGMILESAALLLYCFMNKRKLKREGNIIVADSGGYLTPQISLPPTNTTQGQSSIEINHYASLGNTLPQPASVYEPLKLYENYNKSRK
ncbi:hypothetical protein LOTGIDRAFT_237848 [Lottia gigantea]|uniref:Uncharacterized protein n=1 Tax=Lottia gigantea TaxID=225164 RepID=V4CKE1_LOTGI|nr:hypothetical protein LOTGIDRAFT_237848 [Lottia gigantea]ESP02710.1 hypothetical protein LOTGIDRAFT_237848 [Lottia gigantea]